MKKTLFILVAALVSLSSLKAQKVEVITKSKPGWMKIGETTVDFKTDKDVVLIVGNNAFKSLQIKATDAPVHISTMTVIYSDGDPEAIPVRYDFKGGTTSRPIDLKGFKSKIKEIDFIYNTVPNMKADKAHIEIWGLK